MTPSQVLLSNPLSPPTSNEAPTFSLPTNMMVMISDESYPSWKTVYRGNVSTTWADTHTLEETMPLWLLEYLLFNKAAVPHASKISFVLLPNPDPDGEQLPELLNVYATFRADSDLCLSRNDCSAQSKLTASKYLRVRKLTHHVCGQDLGSRLSSSHSRCRKSWRR